MGLTWSPRLAPDNIDELELDSGDPGDPAEGVHLEGVCGPAPRSGDCHSPSQESDDFLRLLFNGRDIAAS